jgi:hypothetical protein
VSEALQQTVSIGRRIALMTPAAGAASRRAGHALKLFESALFVLRGATAVPWTITGPEVAQVLVVHENESEEQIGAWRGQGKLLIMFSTEPQRGGARRADLAYPFRTGDVLALLTRLDEELTRRPTPVRARKQPQELDRWSLVDALFTVRAVENDQAWLVARTARTPVLWIRGDAGAYAADPAAVQVMRDGSLELHRLQLRRSPGPGPDLDLRSGMELSWFAGFHASEALAPQLQANVPYRIQRWPGFEQIRPQPVQLRLAAALSSRPTTLEQIVGERMFPRNMAIRTFNALYACGLLVKAPAVAVEEPRQGLARLFGNMRRQKGRPATGV